MDEMRMKQRQEPEVFYYDYATPLGMLRIEENGRGLTAVSPVKPECASCHTSKRPEVFSAYIFRHSIWSSINHEG